MDLSQIKGLSEECVLQLDGSDVIVDISGATEIFFEDCGSLVGKEITAIADFYDYQTGSKLYSLKGEENSIVSISTEKLAVTVQLKVRVKGEISYIFLKKLDFAEREIVRKCEYENKKDFLDVLGKLSHDFNNLLGVVMGHAELANYVKSNEESRANHINQVLVSSTKIKNLLKQVLVYRHHLDEKPQELCDLKTIIDMSVSDVRLLMQKPVSIKVRHSEAVSIKQSMSKMIDVFRNVIRNAVESLDEDGEVYIEIQSPGDGFHEVIIRDTGIGMSVKTMEKVFEPFFSTHSRMKCAGVGLSIAKGVLDSIGGAIEISSELGKGTEVHIFVPEYQVQSYKGKVLLVDDEQMILDVTGDMIESLGYQVVRCEDLKQSEEALNNGLFDILLVDHHIKEGTGLDLIVYARSKGIKTPAILSCGHHQESDFEKGQIEGFLMKPTSIKEIEQMFNSVLLN